MSTEKRKYFTKYFSRATICTTVNYGGDQVNNYNSDQDPSNKKESKKEIIQNKIIELIQYDHYKQGDKLPSERELAQLLNVSRNVLREAVVSLVSIGAIEVRDRQGIFVKNNKDIGALEALNSMQMLPADFVSYQLEVRLIISVPAAKLAAQRRTDNDLRKLHDCYDNFVNCPYTTEEEQFENGKWEALLHHLVAEAAHNPILSRVNEGINALVERNNMLIHPNLLHDESGWMKHIQEQHSLIIRAIEEKNSSVAGEITQQHMIESYQIMKERHPQFTTDLSNPYWTLL